MKTALQKGLSLFNARRYAAACAQFEEAARLDPGSSQAEVFLAHALQCSGEHRRALSLLRALVKRRPDDGAARAGLADMLCSQGRLAESAAQYERAAVLLDGEPKVLVSLANLQLRLNEKSKARESLEKAVALGAGPEASLLLGELLKSSGDSRQADSLLRQAAERSAPRDRRDALMEGLRRFRANAKLGRWDESFAEADKLLKGGPAQDCIDGLIVTPEPSELQQTLEGLKEFSSAHSKSPWPAFFRACLLSNMGRGDEALREMSRFDKLPARYAWMRCKRGELLMVNRRDYPAAQREYEAALRGAPEFWRARAASAENALCRGAPARAFKTLELLVKAMPAQNKPWAQAAQGRLLLWSGRYAEALACLEPGVQSGVPQALRHRGAALLLLEKWDQARSDLDESLRQTPSDSEALTWRGELKRRRGDFKGALEDLAAARRQDSANPIWSLANGALAKGAMGDAHGMWTDFQNIRRDVLDAFEKAAKTEAKSPAQTDKVRAVLEAGLRLARGMRATNEYLFPVWMRTSHGIKP
ncbi:MAG: tetratricopeptide repeat protein [Elusimicrobia bacterium]|nr:tetratricopeptide repeat protein [Elusimicrobiota bacterium]